MPNFFNNVLAASYRNYNSIIPVSGIPVYLPTGQSNTTGVIPYFSRPQWFKDLNNVYSSVQIMDNPSNIYEDYSLDFEERYSYEMHLYKLLVDYKQTNIYSIKQDESGTSISPEAKATSSGYWTTDLASIPAGKKQITPDWEARILNGLQLLTDAQIEHDLKCVIWHQGESDSGAPELYYDELKLLIARIRTVLNRPNLRWVLGGINTSSVSYSQVVQDAKIQIASEDPNVYFVGVANGLEYLNADELHWNDLGGQDFANGVFNVIKDW